MTVRLRSLYDRSPLALLLDRSLRSLYDRSPLALLYDCSLALTL